MHFPPHCVMFEGSDVVPRRPVMFSPGPSTGPVTLTMRTPTRRPFSLLDLMIAVASASGAMTILLWIHPGWRPLPDGLPGVYFFQSNRPILFEEAWGIASPVLAGASLALAAMRWSGPRPVWRRAIRQPGFVGLVAALLAIASAIILGSFADAHWNWLQDFFHPTEDAEISEAVGMFARERALWLGRNLWMDGSIEAPGAAVLGAWVALGLSGRWSAEEDWVGRCSRIACLGWVAYPILNRCFAPLSDLDFLY